MKKKMSLQELAQYTYQGLRVQSIEVVLSGGACVSIYTENAYQSGNLDFIRQLADSFEKVSIAMATLGFERNGRHFIHPEANSTLNFRRRH